MENTPPLGVLVRGYYRLPSQVQFPEDCQAEVLVARNKGPITETCCHLQELWNIIQTKHFSESKEPYGKHIWCMNQCSLKL